jgi:transcriptional regulator with GAF, ATPase, and Fis domain
MEEINVLIKKALKIRDLTMEVELLRDELSRISRGNQIIGESPQIKEVMDLVNRVAKSNATVLILGESGTGKELVANAIHYNSDRKNKPFVKVNCGALPENLLESELFGHEKGAFTGAISRKIGRFERAHGGSIFLDEIGEMSFSTQVKLLRVLQEKQIERVGSTEVIDVDVRIIAATNKDLKRLVEEGRFREDLYYRLNVIPIKIPPLRERKQDIPLLVKYFLQKYSLETGRRGMTISDSALDKLKTYSWPGNIRELQNVIERAVILSPGREITEDQLPPEIVKRDRQVELDEFKLPKNGVNLNDLEKSLIKQALDMTNDNQTEAARLLGITRHTLIYRMEKYGLKDRN